MSTTEYTQSLWYESDTDSVLIVDQTLLPQEFAIKSLKSLEEVCEAIEVMRIRGAPLIGVAAAYGIYFALHDDPSSLDRGIARLADTRPTAINLCWALDRCVHALRGVTPEERAGQALKLAQIIEKEDIAICESIGESGAGVLEGMWKARQGEKAVINVLTHCNAGALAAVNWGTALSVVYKAAERGVPIHVWVDETRPRNQGAALTCWELKQRRISHTLIVDNAGGLLMQQGKVDLCLVGSDRTTRRGDVCNKVGTYLKALAARDNDVPFYVALPVSSIDFNCSDGTTEIPIEQRSEDEVLTVTGYTSEGDIETVTIAPASTKANNYAFDVTPAHLVTALITERGVVAATAAGISGLRQ